METTKDVVRNYIHTELKQTTLSDEERKVLNDMLLYMDKNEITQQNEWQSFLAKAEENEVRWNTIYKVEGITYEYEVHESDGLLNFGMNVGTERYRSWLFEVDIFIHNNRRFIFHCVDEELDELELSSFEELEEKIEQFLASDAFK